MVLSVLGEEITKQLAKNTYRKLLDDIAGICDRALKDARLFKNLNEE